MAESVRAAPSTLIHRRFQQLKDLGMTPYKVQLGQELKPIDHPMSFRLAKGACDRFTEVAD